jgi:pimeloyl-ACP methyl ester carboxylesterase
MTAPAFCHLDWAGRPVEIEFQWHHARQPGRPLLVFLHEGLGSLSMWRDYPAALCSALDWNGLVYSRPAYGRSTPRPPDEHWQPDFLERQALEVLPALLRELRVHETFDSVWLLGHSDGGSIALMHAAHHPDKVQGLVVVAPHVMVEDVAIQSIEQAREAYRHTDLKARLARHHQDPDSAFWGWNGVWLSPAFRHWSMEDRLQNITCPVLAVQGSHDEYGTLAQIERIAALAPRATRHVIPGCGHSPHRDQPEALTQAVVDFVARAV